MTNGPPSLSFQLRRATESGVGKPWSHQFGRSQTSCLPNNLLRASRNVPWPRNLSHPRRTRRHTLRSSTVGALPILNDILRRMRLAEFLRAALPPEDRRMKLSPVKALLVLLRNLLVSPSRFTASANGRHAMPPTPSGWPRWRSSDSTTTAWDGHWTDCSSPTCPPWSWPWPRTSSGNSASL